MTAFKNLLFTHLSSAAQDHVREFGRDFLEEFDKLSSPAQALVKPYRVRFEDDVERAVLDEIEGAGLVSFHASPKDYLLTDVGKTAIVSCRDEFE